MAFDSSTLKWVGIGVLLYFVYEHFANADLAASIGTGATGAGTNTGAGATTPVLTTDHLTLADANTLRWSSSIPQADIDAIHAQLNTKLANGQVDTIAKSSVLEYMLGWGNSPAGTVKTISGHVYAFDGAKWNLNSASNGQTVVSGNGTVSTLHGVGFAPTIDLRPHPTTGWKM